MAQEIDVNGFQEEMVEGMVSGSSNSQVNFAPIRENVEEQYESDDTEMGETEEINNQDELNALENVCGIFIRDLNSNVDLKYYEYRDDLVRVLVWLKKNSIEELKKRLWHAFVKHVLRNFDSLKLWQSENLDGSYKSGTETYTYRLIAALCRRFNVCISFIFFINSICFFLIIRRLWRLDWLLVRLLFLLFLVLQLWLRIVVIKRVVILIK